MLCLKRQFAGLRYGLYITVQLQRVVGDSSVDSELPFCAKGTYRGDPVGLYLYPRRSFLTAEISLPLVMSDREEGGAKGLLLPHHQTGKCVSCVARCSFADGTIYSRGIVVFKYLLLAARANSRELLPSLRQFFFPPLSPFRPARESLSPVSLSLSRLLFYSISLSSPVPSYPSNPLTALAIATGP